MVSALTRDGANKTIRALELGAVHCVAKPAGTLSRTVAEITDELRATIRAVAGPRRPRQPRNRWPGCPVAAIGPSRSR